MVAGRKVAEIPVTGESMEELDKHADLQGLRFLSGTFSETLKQMKVNTSELSRINDRINKALEIHKDIDDRKVHEIKDNYDDTRKKIRALEELSALKKLQDTDSSLYQVLGGAPPVPAAPAPESEFEETAGPGGSEDFDDFNELEDFDDFDELEDLAPENGADDFLEELVDDSDDDLFDGLSEELDEEDVEEFCPECNQPVPANASKCPNCGVEFVE